MRVVGKMAKDVGTAIRKSIMVSFLPCLVTDSIPTCFFIFLKGFLCDLFQLFFWGGGGGGGGRKLDCQ